MCRKYECLQNKRKEKFIKKCRDALDVQTISSMSKTKQMVSVSVQLIFKGIAHLLIFVCQSQGVNNKKKFKWLKRDIMIEKILQCQISYDRIKPTYTY